MQAGALDYIEEPLSAAEIVALLETYVAPQSATRAISANQTKGARPRKERLSKVESDGARFEERV
jgi:FixJ family two-component response regulator